MVYEEFFKWYPYCYGYWKKYSDLEKKNGFLDKCENVFKAGIKAIPLSIDLWIHYLNFMSQNTTENTGDSTEKIRRLFEDAIEDAGMEFRSGKLWDAYIDFEKSQGNLKSVLKIYDQLLSTPTQQYMKNFTSFKEWVENNKPSEILTTEEYMKLLGEVESIPPGVSVSEDDTHDTEELSKPPGEEAAVPTEGTVEEDNDQSTSGTGDEEASKNAESSDETQQMKEKREDYETQAVRAKIISIRETTHKETEEEVKKRWHFEDGIKRPYFHVKPLERMQLRNWREYLDFEIDRKDHKRICFLFERCLIACALYEEFWQKYITYLESVQDTQANLADVIRNAYERACTIHLTKKPNIILNWAAFEERQANLVKAREILKDLDESTPGMVMVALRRAGLERRNGAPEKGIQMLTGEMEKASNSDEKSFWAIKCAKYFTKILHDKDSAKEVLHKAIEVDKGNKKLYLNLLDLEISEDTVDEKKLETLCSLVENCEELSMEFKQGFFQRKLEILEDFGSSVHNIVKAYETYQQTYKIKPGVFLGKKRTLDNSVDGQKAKAQKVNEVHTGMSASSNHSYSNSTYPTHDATLPSATAYSYPAAANPWGAYAAQSAGGYYGWYNPYGAYSQPQAQ